MMGIDQSIVSERRKTFGELIDGVLSILRGLNVAEALSSLEILHQARLHRPAGNQAIPKPPTLWFPAIVV